MNAAVRLPEMGNVRVIDMTEAIWASIQVLAFKLEVMTYGVEIGLVSFFHEIVPAVILLPPW